MGKGTDDYIVLMFQTVVGLWAVIVKQPSMLYNYTTGGSHNME